MMADGNNQASHTANTNLSRSTCRPVD